jgi:RNA polymerase sigma-70 factor (ECF subfamily)
LQDSDAELVESACGGDVDSFRLLYERYYGMAVGIARSRLPDVHLAEDAAQEAFAVACRRLHSLRDGAKFSAWLAIICRRGAIRMARTHKRGVQLQQEPVVRANSGPDGCCETARVNEAIGRLPAPAREIVQLHYFSGLSHEEIAETLKISPQAVHGRLQRARRALAGWLSENGNSG